MKRSIATLAAAALAAWLALLCTGHYAKPHGDFFEFREAGASMVSGELPATTKRAPLFPLLIGAGERLLGALGVETPSRVAAQWINAALLPLIAWLAMLLARGWGVQRAWIAGIWVATLPLALHMTAHELVEPLLVALMLATGALVQRQSRWAYATAALASLTRYDAAGLILGVAVAELAWSSRTRLSDAAAANDGGSGGARRRGVGAIALRGLLASAPLCAWLVLTASTWSERSRDHYLRQMAERPTFDVAWIASATVRVAVPMDDLRIPLVDAAVRDRVAVLCRWGVGIAALGALATLLRRREGTALTLLVGGGAYLAVHAAFPFQIERFAYPLAAMLVPLACAGVASALRAGAGRSIRRGVELRRIGLLAFGVLSACQLAVCIGEWSAARDVAAIRPKWLTPMVWVAGAGALVVAACHVAEKRSAAGRSRRAGNPSSHRSRLLVDLAVGLTASSLALCNTRAALPVLGDGDEMRGVVDAARWTAARQTAGESTLSGVPGLLRLYRDDRETAPHLGFEQIDAPTWEGILEECRVRHVVYILQYDDFLSEQGAYYSALWRLERFVELDEQEPRGLELVHECAGPPRARVFRVRSAPP